MAQAGQIFISDIEKDARELYDQWIHLGPSECHEQIDAHLESWNYPSRAIDRTIQELFWAMDKSSLDYNPSFGL